MPSRLSEDQKNISDTIRGQLNIEAASASVFNAPMIDTATTNNLKTLVQTANSRTDLEFEARMPGKTLASASWLAWRTTPRNTQG